MPIFIVGNVSNRFCLEVFLFIIIISCNLEAFYSQKHMIQMPLLIIPYNLLLIKNKRLSGVTAYCCVVSQISGSLFMGN